MGRRYVTILVITALTQTLSAQVIINELLASNRTTHVDPQGEYDDWIELYNPTNQTVDLAGMYLSDNPTNPTKWQFPFFQPALTRVTSGGYLVVWADGDSNDAGLHTNFSLKAAGEELSLFAIDGVTVLDSIRFEAQREDISWGRFPDATANWQLLDIPSPGAANQRKTQGFVATPQVSVGSRLFAEPFTVSLSCATEGATLYYTLDGSDPDIFSARPGRGTHTLRYQRPLTIARGTALRVAAFKEGWEPSPIVNARYVYRHPELEAFRSNLPVMLVASYESAVGNNQGPVWCCLFEPQAGAATVDLSPSLQTPAGLDIRGQSSTSFPKKQYHLEIWDQGERDLDLPLLGMPAESDWVLQGPYSDKSLMRNVLAYQWARDMGHYAPRTRFIELFLDERSDALRLDNYVGVYVLMEKIKISPYRVAVTELSQGDVAEPEISGGYIIKKDKDPTREDLHFITSSGQDLIYADPKGADLHPTQRQWVVDYFNRFEAALYGPAFTDPNGGYAAFVDVNSWVDLHLLVELTKNIDGYRLSNYITKDRLGKLVAGPAWDYNLSLGNANYLDGWEPEGWYFNPGDPRSHPWWPRMFEDPAFRLRYADRWFAFRREVLATERLLENIDTYAQLLAEAQQRNYERWPVLGQYVWPNWFVARTYQEEINWMKQWLQARVAWMDQTIAAEHAAAPVVFSQQGGQVPSGYRLQMTAPAERIVYTLDGSDPYQRGIGRMVKLVPEEATKQVLVPNAPVNEAWKGGASFFQRSWLRWSGLPGGIGYELGAGYESYIGLNLADRMAGKRAGCYVRIPFHFDGDLGDVVSLTLNMRYDDGFVAYLNGQEVARANVTHDPTWASNADAQHSDSLAVQWQAFPLTDLSVLKSGENLLAIHGLNVSTSSSDFLLAATLDAGLRSEKLHKATSFVYTNPIPLYQTTRVKARAWSQGRWSALNEVVFTIE